MIAVLFFKLANFIFALLDKYRVSYYKYLYRLNVKIENHVLFGRYSSVVLLSTTNSFLSIGERTKFRRFCIITLDAGSQMTIGKDNFFNNNCSLNCLGRITIGDNNLFGESVKLYDHNHIFNQKDILVVNQGFKRGEIKIGNNCWIGSNCTILNNVTIGDNVVVGANCLIHTSIPSNTIVRSAAKTLNSDINFI